MAIELIVDSVDTSGQVKSLQLLVDALDKLKGSGTALNEMRKLLVGIKGHGSALDEIRKAAEALGGATGGFDKVVQAVHKMREDLQIELRGIRVDMLAAGNSIGKNFTKGIADSTEAGKAEVVTKTKSIAAAAKRAATAEYQKLVSNEAFGAIAPSNESKLYSLMQEGASLSNYHRRIAKGWANSHRDAAKEILEQIRQVEDAKVKTLADKAQEAGIRRGRVMGDFSPYSAKNALEQTKVIANEQKRLNNERFDSSVKLSKNLADVEISEAKRVRKTTLDLQAAADADLKSREMNRGFAAIKSRDTYFAPNKAAQEDAMWKQQETAAKKATDLEVLGYMHQREAIANFHKKSLSETAARQSAFDVIEKEAAKKKLADTEAYYAKVSKTKSSQEAAMWKQQETAWVRENNSYLRSLKTAETALEASLKRRAALLADKAQEFSIRRNSVWGDFSPYNAKSMRSVTARESTVDPYESIKSAVAVATNQSKGAYQRYNAGTQTSGGLVKPEEVSKWSTAFKKLGDDMGYAHSSARGLASGFGLLWLTWGAMAPMFAGAGLSHGLMEVARSGMAVEQSLMKIKILSNESQKDIEALNFKMIELGRNGIMGPAEIADAMKVMSLAGLKASEVYSSVGTVMNFAIAGDTTIAKSADVLTGVAQAFKLTADDYNYVADIISVAAATSKSSVESMGEAFKTSSVVHSQYGASLKDVALVQSMLANVQVTGTAAGTATRNMLSDLTGRTPKAVKALKELGVSMKDIIDENGKIKPLQDVFSKLLTGLSEKGGRDQFKYLRDIFTERGEKGGVEMIANIKKMADELNISYVAAFQKLAKEIDESAGFTIISAAKMSMTAQNEVAAVTATLKTSLVSTFETMRPYLIVVSRELKAAFGSEEFREGVKTAIILVGQLTTFIVEHAKALAYLTFTYLGIKGVILVVGGLAAAWINVGRAIGFAATAQALFAKSPIGLVMTGVALAVGAAAAVWEMYSDNAKEAAEEQSRIGGEDISGLLDKLVKQREHLEKVAAARKANISLMEYEMRLAGLSAKSQADAKVLEARKVLDNARYRKDTFSEVFGEVVLGEPLLKRKYEIEDAEAALKVAEKQAAFDKARVEAETYAIKALRSEPEGKASKGGLQNLLDDVAKGGKGAFGFDTYKDTLSEVDKAYTNQTESIKRQLNTRLEIIKSLNAAGLKSDADTAKESYAITLESERKQQAALNETNEKRNKLLRDEKAKFGPNYESLAGMSDAAMGKITDPTLKAKVDAAKAFSHKLTQEAEKQRNDQRQFSEQVEDRINSYSNAYLEKIGKGLLDVNSSNVKLQESNDKLAASEKLIESFAGKRPEEIARLQARNAVLVQWTDELSKADSALAAINIDLAQFEQLMMSGDVGATLNWFNALDVKDRLTAGRAKLKSGISETADKAGTNAYTKDLTEQYTKFTDEFKATMSGSISTAIFEGGAEGGKKLRNYLQQVLIQRPFKIILEGAIDEIMGVKSGSSGMGWMKKAFSFLTGAPEVSSSLSSSGIPSMSDFSDRASGGTTKPNSMYRVNEQGIEMLSVGGKDYLMNGAQQGRITPAGQVGSTVTYAPQINIDSRTDQAQVYALVDRAVKQGNAKLVDDLRQARVI